MATKAQAIEGTIQILSAAVSNSNFQPISTEAWDDLLENAEKIFVFLNKIGKGSEEADITVL